MANLRWERLVNKSKEYVEQVDAYKEHLRDQGHRERLAPLMHPSAGSSVHSHPAGGHGHGGAHHHHGGYEVAPPVLGGVLPGGGRGGMAHQRASGDGRGGYGDPESSYTTGTSVTNESSLAKYDRQRAQTAPGVTGGGGRDAAFGGNAPSGFDHADHHDEHGKLSRRAAAAMRAATKIAQPLELAPIAAASVHASIGGAFTWHCTALHYVTLPRGRFGPRLERRCVAAAPLWFHLVRVVVLARARARLLRVPSLGSRPPRSARAPIGGGASRSAPRPARRG